MSETFSGPTGLDGLPTNGILTQYFELFKFKFQLDEEKKCQLILMLQQFFLAFPGIILIMRITLISRDIQSIFYLLVS